MKFHVDSRVELLDNAFHKDSGGCLCYPGEQGTVVMASRPYYYAVLLDGWPEGAELVFLEQELTQAPLNLPATNTGD